MDRVVWTQIEQNQMELDRYRSLKRILEEFYQMQSNPSDDFKCCLLERNPYEWQFGIRGPSGTELEGGIYHGRIQFPEKYPSKPPSFTLLTENGCFKTQNQIGIRRLNDWQPSWRVRDGLLALIDEMHTYPDGELDSVEYNREERPDLAIKSRAAAPKYGTAERQKVIDEIHEYLLSKSPPVPVPQVRRTRNVPCQEEVVVDRVGSTQMELDRSVIVEDKSNIQNSGEKRILEEYNEIESNPSNDFKCLKLDWNPYEWQFAIRGPSGTEFEGGIYHGVVQFSEGYPSKPPSIMFLTKNGRFKIQTDISARLLSNWQSPRIVRNALLALIEEMPTYPDGDGELDSVKYNKNIMRELAIKSRTAAPKYGTSERQKVIDAIHEYMLSKAPPVPQLQPSSLSQNGAEGKHGRGTGSVFYNITGNKVHATNGRVRFLRSMNEPPEPMLAKMYGLLLVVLLFLLFLSIHGILSGRKR
ncbi:hypothetical protein L3X38_039550 [Prunus dulcis]|uniref:UBC core domain-containing protein n=1 Tax=Prunus dulcis TaxID=3755 RepID=A0AAD4V8V0_PRUDU|nr:hypothetical protein L3X38_039550 [Prunus dulcis]